METIDKTCSDAYRSSYAVILSGGKGTRLYALTARRAKPAVPMMGSYRMIDFPMSNCARSEIDFVSILTQYEPDSLERHIKSGTPWGYDERNLAVRGPSEKRDGLMYYKGTAAAVREVQRRIQDKDSDLVLVLSGDHVYSEDYRKAMDDHKYNESDLTIYTKVVPLSEAPNFGVMKVNDHGRIMSFYEKPKDKDLLESFRMSDEAKKHLRIDSDEDLCLASMGVYVFSPNVLYKELNAGGDDFGSEIIPRMINSGKDVYAYVFDGYWEDVGRLDKLVEANFFALNNPDKVFNRFLKTNSRDLPPAIGSAENSILAPGVVIHPGAIVKNSVIGYQTEIFPGSVIENSILFGGDRHDMNYSRKIIAPRYSEVRSGAVLKNVLLDRNIVIDEGVELVGKQDEAKLKASFESIGIKENNEDNSNGLYNITPNGVIVIGKPRYEEVCIFPKGFKA